MMQGIRNTEQSSFARLMSNGFHYEIPKYQRDYSWDNEQWDDLWEDLKQIDKDISHYMGYLVLQTSDDRNYQVIDGQQRLTTICILILSVINHLNNMAETEEEQRKNKERAAIFQTRYIGDIDALTLTSTNKLVLNRNNNSFYRNYLASLQNFPKRGLKASDKLLKEAFEFFSEKIKLTYTSAEQLVNFVDVATNNLFFTTITVTDELNAFKVFETLNARGVQLTSSDLLKNYLFSVADANNLHETQINELENIWSELTDKLERVQIADFLFTYWNSLHKAIRKTELYKTIRNEIKTPEQTFSLLRDMLLKADIFIALKNPEDEMWNGKQNISDNLALLELFNVKQPIPMLMTAYANLPEKEFESLLSKVVVISFRYNIICGKNPNDQENAYNKVALSISTTKTYSIDVLKSDIYVEDEIFKQMFELKEFIYKSRNNNIAKYILCKIEHFTNQAVVDEQQITLEHILPDNPNEDWDYWTDESIKQYRYRLGNMALLEKSKNKDLENKSYMFKKEVYKTSTIPSTAEIGNSEQTKWTESKIASRQRNMAKKAIGIWQI